MLGTDAFKIVIGDGWLSDMSNQTTHLQQGVEDSIDFGRVRDVVDIVVDGASISGRADEDSIFFLVRDLLYAVEKLSQGEGTARVSFYEGPWELVLQRLRHKVYITFYRSGRRPQVVIKDQVVVFEHLQKGIITSADNLILQAKKLGSQVDQDPLIGEIQRVLDRVEKRPWDDLDFESDPILEPKIIKSTRLKKPRSETGFSFGYQFSATTTDLIAPGRPRGSDLYALLFKGHLVVHARGRRLVLGRGFLFLQTERLLASLRQLLSAWEEGRPMSVRLISEGLVVGVRLGRDDGLVVSLMDSSKEETIVVLNDLTPWEYADAILGLARELRRHIVEVNRSQRRNMRLEAFSREVKLLHNWKKEQQRDAVINEDVERYQTLDEPRRAIPSNVVIGAVSHLRFQERWRLEVEGLDLNSTQLCGDMATISSKGLILGVETDTGAVVWRREKDGSHAMLKLAGPDGLVRATPSGQVELIDLYTGAMSWRTNLAPRSGGAPVLLVVEHGPAPGIVIAAEEDRKLVALDKRSGEPRWRFVSSRGGSFVLMRYGRLLYVLNNDSHFNAVDVEDGSLVWRFKGRTRFCVPPAISGDTVLAIGGRPGRPEGRIYALDAIRGKAKWSKPLKGGAMTAPIIANGVALVPIRANRQYEFVGIDIASGEELWRRSCSGWANPAALMALDKNFIINSGGGVVRAIGAVDGQERWTTVLGPSCSDDMPLSLKVVLRGGMLFVPADTVYVVRPEDGHMIHSLGGEPPVPDLLQVDPSCAVFAAEDSGHIAMYNLSNRLSVIS